MNTCALVLLVVSVATFASGSDAANTKQYKFNITDGPASAAGVVNIKTVVHRILLGEPAETFLLGKLFVHVTSPHHNKILERTYTSLVPLPGNAQQIGVVVNAMLARGRDFTVRAAKNVKLAAKKTEAITLTPAASAANGNSAPAPAAAPPAAPAAPPATAPAAAAPPASSPAAPPAAPPAKTA